MPTSLRSRFCTLGAVTMAFLAAHASASAPEGTERLDSLIDALDAPNYVERQEASARLSIDDTITLKDIERTLQADELSAEQRRRLLQIGEARFRTSDRAAMGVRFGGVLRSSRIVISDTFEYFPSSAVLEPGDIIQAANGIPLGGDRSWATLRALIIARDPGDRLPVTIRRGAEQLSVDVELGAYRNLEGSRITDADYLNAWVIRSNPLRGTPGVLVDPLAEPEMFLTDDGSLQKLRAKALAKRANGPRLIAGGEPRGGEPRGSTLRLTGQAAIAQRAAVQQRRAGFANAEFMIPAERSIPLEDELRTVTVEEERRVAEIDAMRDRIAEDPTSVDSERIRTELSTKLKELRIVRKEREAVEAEIAERDGAATAEVEGTP